MENGFVKRDYSGELSALAEVLNNYVWSHCSRLKQEKLRLFAMSFETPKVFERFMHYKPRMEEVSTDTDILLYLSEVDKKVAFNDLIFGTQIPSNYIPSEHPNRTLDQIVIEYPERKQLLDFLIRLTDKLIEISRFFVPDALLNYVIGIKHMDSPDLYGPYPAALLSSSQASAFVVKLFKLDPALADGIVSLLCQRINNLRIRDSFLTLDIDAISHSLDSLGDYCFPSIKFLTLIERIIPLEFVTDMDSLFFATRKLFRDYIFDPTIDPDAIKKSVWDLEHKYSYSYLIELWDRLDSEKSVFSTGEYSIIEKALPSKDLYSKMIEAETYEDKITSKAPIIELPRVNAPIVFNSNPQGFSELFELLRNTYISTSLECFLYLFSLSNERPDNLEPIIWLKPMDDLKCFLEVLYPRNSKYGDFQRIFVNKEKKHFNLGSNPLQCRKRDAKKVDKAKKQAQDMKMKSFERLINSALRFEA